MTNIINAQTTNESVFKSLRSLMPQRVLSYAEALQRAEVQASRLLSLHGINTPGVPTEIVTELPRVRVAPDYDLPVSGAAHWDGYNWVISVNASEFELRQRFSVMHEFKHIIDHPTRHLIQGDKDLSAEDMAERVADYFAACVLMPKAWVKSAFCTKTQSISELADMFRVSQKAMSFRLDQLGLVGQRTRYHKPTYRPSVFKSFPRRTYMRGYLRTLPLTNGASL